MTYIGHVKGGAILLDEPVDLPEGSVVSIELVKRSNDTEVVPSLAERLADIIGIATELPSDGAENHDHYLYGTPKK